jgi:hypothetical protein
VGPTAGLDELDMRKNPFPLPGIAPQFPGYPAHSLVTTPTTLLWLSLAFVLLLMWDVSLISTQKKITKLTLFKINNKLQSLRLCFKMPDRKTKYCILK